MHVIRLLNEGIELMRSSVITLPRPEKDLLVTIRTGNYGSLERVLSLANSLFVELDRAQGESALPEEVDRLRVSRLISDTYLEHWRGTRRARLNAHDLEVLNSAADRLNSEVGDVLKDQVDV